MKFGYLSHDMHAAKTKPSLANNTVLLELTASEHTEGL